MYKRPYSADYFDTTPLRSDLKRRSMRSGAVQLAGNAASTLLRFTSTVILARLLLPEHFGLISMVTAVTAIATTFKDFGLAISTIQSKDINHQQVNALFWINVVLGLFLMAIMASLAQLVAQFYEEPRLVWIMVAISTTFISSGLAVQHAALLNRRMEFKSLVLVDVSTTLLSALIGIVLASRGFGYWALAWKEVASSAFYAMGCWAACPWRPTTPSTKADVAKMINMGRDMTAFNLLNYSTRNLDQILIGKVYGAEPLGIYRQGYSLASQLFGVFSSVAQSIGTPALSALQCDADRYAKYVKNVITWLSFVTMPIAILAVIHSKDIFLLLMGVKWLKAGEIFGIFALGMIIKPTSAISGLVMVTHGKTKRLFWLTMWYSIILILGFAIGIRWGGTGVAWADTIITYTLFVPWTLLSLKETHVRGALFFGSMWRSFIASVLTGALLLFINKLFPVNSALLSIARSILISAVSLGLLWNIIPGGRTILTAILMDLHSGFVSFRRNIEG